jgi:UPF0042 nucleotide-binding protein
MYAKADSTAPGEAPLSSLLIIAGISGAGRSTALRTIGDLGYYVIDNLPLGLFPAFLRDELEAGLRYKNLALTLDLSNESKVKGLEILVATMREFDLPLRLVFLEANSSELLKRYSETRRPHPVYDPLLDQDLRDTVERERALLAPIQALSSFVVDTSVLNVHDLKRTLTSFAESINARPLSSVYISLESFGFKHGMLNPCDLLLDVRFLKNPYFEESLRAKTGLNPDVFNYVMNHEESQEIERRFLHLLDFLIPRYIREGKSHITIGIGCTGGKHRSVSLVESIFLKIKIEGFTVIPIHRDIER